MMIFRKSLLYLLFIMYRSMTPFWLDWLLLHRWQNHDYDDDDDETQASKKFCRLARRRTWLMLWRAGPDKDLGGGVRNGSRAILCGILCTKLIANNHIIRKYQRNCTKRYVWKGVSDTNVFVLFSTLNGCRSLYPFFVLRQKRWVVGTATV